MAEARSAMAFSRRRWPTWTTSPLTARSLGGVGASGPRMAFILDIPSTTADGLDESAVVASPASAQDGHGGTRQPSVSPFGHGDVGVGVGVGIMRRQTGVVVVWAHGAIAASPRSPVPVWSVVVIAVDVVVIYALCAHGSEGKSISCVSSDLSALRQLTNSARPTRRGTAGGAIRTDVP